MEFDRPILKHEPLRVDVTPPIAREDTLKDRALSETDNILNKLMDHVAIIQDFRDRIDAFDFLIENAKKLAGNLRFETNDDDLIRAIEAIGGEGPYVDLKLFERAIDTVIDNYESMAVISFTGAARNGR